MSQSINLMSSPKVSSRVQHCSGRIRSEIPRVVSAAQTAPEADIRYCCDSHQTIGLMIILVYSKVANYYHDKLERVLFLRVRFLFVCVSGMHTKTASRQR